VWPHTDVSSRYADPDRLDATKGSLARLLVDDPEASLMAVCPAEVMERLLWRGMVGEELLDGDSRLDLRCGVRRGVRSSGIAEQVGLGVGVCDGLACFCEISIDDGISLSPTLPKW